MPVLSVWALRLALSYLAAGFTLGSLMLAAPGLSHSSSVLLLRPMHREFLLVGWMVQLAFGVAFWILPRKPGSHRGTQPLALTALLLLNLGILSAGLGGTLKGPPAVIIAGRSAELLAGLAFAAHVWPRARLYSPRKSPV
jgi:hypothetical protein